MIRKMIATAAVFAAGFGIGWWQEDPAEAKAWPICHEEDGRLDGLPCIWTDPDTGRHYFVNSRNYR